MSNDRKNVIWNMLGASFNAFNSVFLSIVVTRINGIDDAGIFTFAFATACLLFCIGNYCGRTFQVTDISKKNSDTDYIYNRIITCIIMMFITIGFVLIKGYDMYKSTIFIALCFYKCLEAFSEAFYAIIQKNGELYKVGISMFLKAVVALGTVIVVDIITHNLIISVLSIVLVNIVFILFYDVKNIRKIKFIKTKFTKQANFNIFKTGFFTFILTILSIYIVNAPRYAIDDILTNDLQTIFGIIILPAAFMSLIGQYIIQPALTKIANCIENMNYKGLKDIIKKIVLIMIGIGALVTIVAWFLEVPVLEFVYGIELSTYFNSMMVIIAGSILYSLITILSAILIAMRKTFYQTVIYGIASIIITIIGYNLVMKDGVHGASITYTIAMLIIFVMFSGYTIINMIKYKNKWKSIGG